MESKRLKYNFPAPLCNVAANPFPSPLPLGVKYILFPVYTLLLLILSACNPAPDSQTLFPKTEEKPLFFNINEFEKKYKDLNTIERWSLIEELIKQDIENPLLAEKWIDTKLKQLTVVPEKIPAKSLQYTLHALYKSNFTQVSFQTAKNTLAYTSNLETQITQPIASIILLRYYMVRRQLDSAEWYIQKLEETIPLDTSNWLQVALYSEKAAVSEMKGAFFEAIVNYQKALDLVPEGDSFNLFQLNLNIAVTYHSMDFVEKAKFYLDRSIQYIKWEQFPKDQLSTFAIIQSKAGDYTAAQDAFEKGLEYATQKQLPLYLAQIYSNMGNFYRKKQLFEEGLAYMQKSDSICLLEKVNYGILVNQINRAELYCEMKNGQAALKELKEATPLIEQFGAPKVRKEYHKTYYLTYDLLNNEPLANFHFRKYTEIDKDIMGDLPRTLIVEWELGRERETATLNNSKLEVSLQKEKSYKYLITAILSFLLLGVSTIYLLFKRKHLITQQKLQQEKQRIAFELESRSRELLADSIKNISIQNTKEKIKEELEEIIKELPPVHQSKFTPLIKGIATSNSPTVLKEFETRFTGVYEEFYNKLSTIAPTLTPNEIRICALMRLNISTKEIAKMTNRTTGTIDNIRSSIRKKLNLQEEDNLQQYLLEM